MTRFEHMTPISPAMHEALTVARRPRGAGGRRGGPPRRGATYSGMVIDTPLLWRFEVEYQRTAYRSLRMPEALALYGRLLGEARALNPAFGRDWEADLGPDLAIARVVNGLPHI